MNDERHIEFLQKLQRLLQDERMQKMLEIIDLTAWRCATLRQQPIATQGKTNTYNLFAR